MANDKKWGILLHLGMNMWGDLRAQKRLSFDKEVWNHVVERCEACGINMIILDLGEGIRYNSHPEIGIEGSWSPEEMTAEVRRLREKGIQLIPKLNFATTHDAWLGIYERMEDLAADSLTRRNREIRVLQDKVTDITAKLPDEAELSDAIVEAQTALTELQGQADAKTAEIDGTKVRLNTKVEAAQRAVRIQTNLATLSTKRMTATTNKTTQSLIVNGATATLSEEEAIKAQTAAKALFAGNGDDANMPTTEIAAADLTDGKIGFLNLMVKCGLAPSNKQARQLVQQGGVFVNDEKMTDAAFAVTEDMLREGVKIRKGKKVFHKAVLA